MAYLLATTCVTCALRQYISTNYSVSRLQSRMKIRYNRVSRRCACKPATAYCLRKATVAAQFCGVQHKKPPVIRQVFAVITCWHPQFMDQSVSWYAQAMIAQHMVEANCGNLESICVVSQTAIIVSGASQLSSSESHHRSKNVLDV